MYCVHCCSAAALGRITLKRKDSPGQVLRGVSIVKAGTELSGGAPCRNIGGVEEMFPEWERFPVLAGSLKTSTATWNRPGILKYRPKIRYSKVESFVRPPVKNKLHLSRVHRPRIYMYIYIYVCVYTHISSATRCPRYATALPVLTTDGMRLEIGPTRGASDD